MRFSNFTGSGAEVVDALQGWLASYSKPGRGLILSGPVGVEDLPADLSCQNSGPCRISVKFIDFFNFSRFAPVMGILRPRVVATRSTSMCCLSTRWVRRNTDFELLFWTSWHGRYNRNCHCGIHELFIKPASEEQKRNLYDIPLDQHPERHEPAGFASSQFGTLESRVGERIFSRLVETSLMLELSGKDFRRRGGPV